MQQRGGKEGKGEVGKVRVNNFIGEENFALFGMGKKSQVDDESRFEPAQHPANQPQESNVGTPS